MEAEEREVGGQLVGLEGRDLGSVGDHECDVVLAQERHHVGREPAFVPELQRMPERRREGRECSPEPLVVAAEARR